MRRALFFTSSFSVDPRKSHRLHHRLLHCLLLQRGEKSIIRKQAFTHTFTFTYKQFSPIGLHRKTRTRELTTDPQVLSFFQFSGGETVERNNWFLFHCEVQGGTQATSESSLKQVDLLHASNTWSGWLLCTFGVCVLCGPIVFLLQNGDQLCAHPRHSGARLTRS